MTEERAQRRLAAILAADVVGYSRLMEQDEAGTLAALKQRRRDIASPLVAEHRGRIVKVMGDGVLVEFASAVNAVECAIELKKRMASANVGLPEEQRIVLRIGINLGDLVVEGGDLYGGAVNIAARLQAMAEPGEIYVSRTVRDHVKNKIEATFEDLGEQTVRNIVEPVRVYRIAGDGLTAKDIVGALPLPSKPSIAVLSFENLSGDPEQEYFADGMVEDIITALSRLRWLFVIARNSSFAYKGRAVDVKRVGQELGVRYVLEGSVRKAGNRVRITGQLIDASMGVHLWADRFEGALEDLFDLQDQVTASVVGAIAPKLEQAEIERAKRKPTSSLDAYDYYLRGMAAVHLWTREGNEEALVHFRRAIELDPGFASAYGMAARCYSQRKAAGWMVDRERDSAEAERLARRAVELGKEDALALATAGIALAYVVGDLDDGAAFIDQALALNPNLAWAWLFSSYVKSWLGEPEAAIERVTRAMRLNPQDAQFFNMQTAMAQAHFLAGRYVEALSWAEAAVRGHPNYAFANTSVAVNAALAGRPEVAEKAVARLRQLQPQLRVSDLMEIFPIRQPEHRAKWVEGLVLAGISE
jgi:TolB-like protein/class 3 adenylate cyclase/tetratricopeptide (TPR) repeat protein